ncbi:hypothetical protein [Asaia sp. HN010]|uniref:hypothetical protein n=1 Tax=Asaia sp. HN010 TaxID=3081233 RepID=UPI003016917F
MTHEQKPESKGKALKHFKPGAVVHFVSYMGEPAEKFPYWAGELLVRSDKGIAYVTDKSGIRCFADTSENHLFVEAEQKPESAEFRTLDKLAGEIQERLIDLTLERCYPDYSEIMDWLTGAEAIGAEDQRKRYFEGAEPVGYLITEATGRVTFVKKPVSAEDMQEHELTSVAVYSRPVSAILAGATQ